MIMRFIQVVVFTMLLVSCGTTQYREIGFGGNQAGYSTVKWEKPNTAVVISELHQNVVSKVDSMNQLFGDGNSHFDMGQHHLTDPRHHVAKTTKLKKGMNGPMKSLHGLEKPKILSKLSVIRKLKKRLDGTNQGSRTLSWTFFVVFLWVLGISLICLVLAYLYIASAFLSGGLSMLFFAIWVFRIGVFLFWSSLVLAGLALIFRLIS